MAVATGTPAARRRYERLERIWTERPGLVGWLTTTDHKRIGLLYLFATMAFALAGGVEALLMRTQLIGPDLDVVSPAAYSELMTMHGVTMIFLVVIPLSIGAFGNYLVPLMIGARDMAFPRMNALSFWIFVASGIFMYIGLAIGDAPNAGWFSYVPLASRAYDPGLNQDFYALGLIFNGISTTAAAINFIVTIFKLRAPGMSINRMPLFCFAFLAVSFALVFALPPLNTALVFLEMDRRLGFHFFDVAHGGDPLLWQHLFWIFGHPEVYIIILPAFGIATSIIPTFTRRRMVAFPLVALAEILVAFIGFGVWAHHMFAAGLSTIATVYFAAASLIIVIPSGIQLFAWIMTIVTGTPTFRAPLLFIVGFIVFFLLGGLSGVMFAAIPFDQQLTDTYFVVAHFHFVIFGAAVFPILGGLYYWFPKVTGRLYNERAAVASFWLAFVGTALTFFPMHIVGLIGMPRRVYTYPSDMGWGDYNLLETLGSYLLAAGLVLILVNLLVALRRGAPAGPDPWGAPTLEWSTSSPPPDFNYAVVPRVSSAYPMWDVEDREEDARRLDRGELVLDHGHETPTSTVLDADFDEVVQMPSESPWPVVVAAAMAGAFTMLLVGHPVAAAGFAGLVALAVFAWHLQEPAAAVTAAVAERRRLAFANGWWAVALLIATEAALLLCLIASYFYLRSKSAHWPPPGVEEPKVLLPVLLTAGLVATSAPMALGSAAAAAGRLAAARRWVVLALVVQGAYLGIQVHEILADVDKVHATSSSYGSVYLTMLGSHHAHVAIGILLSLGILARLASGLTDYRLVGLRSIALYWHFVNAMAILVVLTQISPAL